METPLRQFLRTETGSAAVLAAATVAALVWANIASRPTTGLGDGAVGPGRRTGVAIDLREFVNSGLMALFFLVVGLEARREWDMGELRVRSRVALPFFAGLGGMVVPIAIYLALNAGPGRPRTAGARRCRPTPHSRSARWPWSAAAARPGAHLPADLLGRRRPGRARGHRRSSTAAIVRWLPLLYRGRRCSRSDGS